MKLSKTLRLTLFLTVVLFLFSTIVSPNKQVEAATTQSATVTVDKLNVRSGAGTKYKKVGTLKKGTKVTVYSKKASGYSEIRFKSKKAYVMTKYLKFSPKGVTVVKYKYKNISKLSYPQVKGLKSKTAEKKINQALLTYASTAYKEYLQMLKDEKEVRKDVEFCGEFSYACDYDYTTSYKVKYNNGKTLSILIYDYAYYGGAHGTGTVTSFNFKISNGQKVKLSDVLNSKTKISKVQRYAYNYMIRHNEIFSVSHLSDVAINNKTQFYYTDSGIILVFQEYEVGPYSSGNPAVKIPSTLYK